ncbi:MAG: LeuD/DmdB family oxidoreductase small subunit [Promethearchaeota archaeon]|jgi:3-isopropylmalate/(R)-2-methylmalate dehydratase small subunit
MKGQVIKYEMKDINTDLIIPARYLISSDPDYLAQHCMEDLDPKFIQKINQHNYKILVAGSNFGCGSSREQAPLALKAAGIQCIIASSFARIFFRNAINIGLPIIECKEINQIDTNDDLEIMFSEGILRNLSKKKEMKVKKMPSFLQDIISADGLINYARRIILNKD